MLEIIIITKITTLTNSITISTNQTKYILRGVTKTIISHRYNQPNKLNSNPTIISYRYNHYNHQDNQPNNLKSKLSNQSKIINIIN